jgi:gamma-butyrobetaine dioxygenase
VLKHNPYASTYSISERDLEEETTGLKDAKKESSRRPPSPKSLPHTTTGVGRRKAQLTATKRQSSTPSRRKDNVSKGPPELLIKQPIRTLTLSPTETIDVRAGGLTLRREGKVRVLGYARLRDACPCPSCIHPSTRQKLRTSGQAYHSADSMQWHYHAPSPDSVTMTDYLGSPGLSVQWQDQDGKPHLSYYDADLIRALFGLTVSPMEHLSRTHPRKIWSGADMAQNASLRFQYDSIMQKGAPDRTELLRVLEQLHVYGLAVIQGVPTNPTDDKTCHLRAVANWIGEIRNTFYGETWNVKSVKDSKNVAYTSLDLGLHMDLL